MAHIILPVLLAVLGAAIAGPVLAAEAAGEAPRAAAAEGPQLSIANVKRGGVRDWVVVDDSTLLIQDPFQRWYKVRLVAPSRDLVHAQALGFDTGPSGALDNTGAVIVRRQKFPVASITAGEDPAKKPKQ